MNERKLPYGMIVTAVPGDRGIAMTFESVEREGMEIHDGFSEEGEDYRGFAKNALRVAYEEARRTGEKAVTYSELLRH